jgi:hypothetical protein
LKAKNLQLILDEKAKDFLVEKGYDPRMGRVQCAGRSRNTWKIRWRKKFSRDNCMTTNQSSVGGERQAVVRATGRRQGVVQLADLTAPGTPFAIEWRFLSDADCCLPIAESDCWR